jgi:hypothetical protein
MKLTKITIQKLTDVPAPDSKKPTHNLVAADEKFENKTTVASLWTKESQYGKFLSGEMKKNRSYEGKDYDGYVIITENEWEEYQSLKNNNKVKSSGFDPSTGEVNTDEIDF